MKNVFLALQVLIVMLMAFLAGCGREESAATRAGQDALAAGRLVDAEKLFSKPAADGDPRALKGMIEISLRRGATGQTLSLLDRLPDDDPLYRARVLERAGRTDEAAAAYRRVIASDPRNGEALYGEARYRIVRGERAQAKLLLERIPPASPFHARAARLLRGLR